MDQVIARQGDTLDAICWRHYGRTAGVTEAVLEANPGLADLGAVLPLGTPIHLPPQAPQPQRRVVQLWD
ncbi:tail protein X [Pseudomonas resinovorans]|uniref:tail protein X n=1 Tax=Metapseudomonas resinovorans TaxID=53412 RepID=UPI00237F64FE|nr:tail protein X [Pseudomonas resinovorans]MDE3738596.1 tail protein X [Pseudomonas resinovorans]